MIGIEQSQGGLKIWLDQIIICYKDFMFGRAATNPAEVAAEEAFGSPKFTVQGACLVFQLDIQ